MKKCSECKIEKDETAFNKNKKYKDGLYYICRDCLNKSRREYNQTNKDKINEYRRRYYQNNKDKLKIYNQTNKDKINEYRRRYYQKHSKEILKYNKKYCHDYAKKNKDHRRNYHNAYAKTHPEKFKNQSQRFKTTFLIKPEIMERDNFHCVCCGGNNKLQAHHILPISYGGEMENHDNLIILCKNCHLKIAHEGCYKAVDPVFMDLANDYINKISTSKLA
jgi:hypothetical protein